MVDVTDRKIVIELDEGDFSNFIRLLNNSDDADHSALLDELSTQIINQVETQYDMCDPLDDGEGIDLVIRVEGEEDVALSVEIDVVE